MVVFFCRVTWFVPYFCFLDFCVWFLRFLGGLVVFLLWLFLIFEWCLCGMVKVSIWRCVLAWPVSPISAMCRVTVQADTQVGCVNFLFYQHDRGGVTMPVSVITASPLWSVPRCQFKMVTHPPLMPAHIAIAYRSTQVSVSPKTQLYTMYCHSIIEFPPSLWQRFP